MRYPKRSLRDLIEAIQLKINLMPGTLSVGYRGTGRLRFKLEFVQRCTVSILKSENHILAYPE